MSENGNHNYGKEYWKTRQDSPKINEEALEKAWEEHEYNKKKATAVDFNSPIVSRKSRFRKGLGLI